MKLRCRAKNVSGLALSGLALACLSMPSLADEAKAPSVAAEPAAQESPAGSKPAESQPAQPPDWHKVRMRLSGSLCASCLREMENIIKKIDGVSMVKTQKSVANVLVDVSPELSNYADTIVIFDANRIPLEDVRADLKKNGYNSYKIVDKPLDHEPGDRDLKF